MTILAAALFAAIVIVVVVTLWAAVALNGQMVGRPEDERRHRRRGVGTGVMYAWRGDLYLVRVTLPPATTEQQ